MVYGGSNGMLTISVHWDERLSFACRGPYKISSTNSKPTMSCLSVVYIKL